MEIFALAYIAFSVLIFIGFAALDASRALHGKKRGKKKEWRKRGPKTLVILPCKGVDLTMDRNLSSIKDQDYGNFDLIAVVDNGYDEAVPRIRKAGIRYIISESKCEKCSGKVRAIATALEKFKGYDAYVIADSDITVDKEWLRAIVSPLEDKRIGLSTMFPVFYPVAGFWSNVKQVWGFVGDAMMEDERTRFGWGGSMAFRKDLLDSKSMEFLRNSRYSVSDDICITKIAEMKKLGIAYVKEHRPIVNSRESLKSLSEWANRQTALTLLGKRDNLKYGVAYYGGEAFLLISGIALAAYVSPLFLIFFAHYLRSLILAYRRAAAKSPYLMPITLIMPFFYLANLIAASKMNSIIWRGRKYRLG